MNRNLIKYLLLVGAVALLPVLASQISAYARAFLKRRFIFDGMADIGVLLLRRRKNRSTRTICSCRSTWKDY